MYEIRMMYQRWTREISSDNSSSGLVICWKFYNSGILYTIFTNPSKIATIYNGLTCFRYFSFRLLVHFYFLSVFLMHVKCEIHNRFVLLEH